jgi:uncharacterized coiled-coil protein SlyX
MPWFPMSEKSALEKIQDLESQIQTLKQEAIHELRQKLADARNDVARLEKELAELTGSPAAPAVAAPRVRRASISDDDLKIKILEVMARSGHRGMNAKEIATAIDQNPIRVRDFVKNNPRVLKRQGTGPGTKFFLP